MDMLLCVDVSATPAGVVVVAARGEVDFSTAGQFEDALRAAHRLLAAPVAVVVDLNGITFLSASGVGVLVTEHHRSRNGGVPLWVVAAHRPVLRTLAVCGALAVLEVVAQSPARSAAHLAEALRDRANGTSGAHDERHAVAVLPDRPRPVVARGVTVVSKIPVRPSVGGADRSGSRANHG